LRGALHQIKLLQLADKTVPFDADARRTVAHTSLARWQNAGSDSEASKFVDQVARTAVALDDQGTAAFRASNMPAG